MSLLESQGVSKIQFTAEATTVSYQYKAIQVPILKGRILGGNLDIQEIQIV